MVNLPSISIITPSYNQGDYIEDTIKSVINQRYPNLEHIIIDGGSTDNTINIIKKYEKHISYWESTKDGGQSEALCKGFLRARGTYIGWQNSDDMYADGCLMKLGLAASQTNVAIISGHLKLSGKNGVIRRNIKYTPLRYQDLPFVNATIPNQCAIFRRDIYETCGGINPTLAYCMDFDLWSKMLSFTKTENQIVEDAFGIYRMHQQSKTALLHDVHTIERAALNKIILNDASCNRNDTIIRKIYHHFKNRHLDYLSEKIWLKIINRDHWTASD